MSSDEKIGQQQDNTNELKSSLQQEVQPNPDHRHPHSTRQQLDLSRGSNSPHNFNNPLIPKIHQSTSHASSLNQWQETGGNSYSQHQNSPPDQIQIQSVRIKKPQHAAFTHMNKSNSNQQIIFQSDIDLINPYYNESSIRNESSMRDGMSGGGVMPQQQQSSSQGVGHHQSSTQQLQGQLQQQQMNQMSKMNPAQHQKHQHDHMTAQDFNQYEHHYNQKQRMTGSFPNHQQSPSQYPQNFPDINESTSTVEQIQPNMINYPNQMYHHKQKQLQQQYSPVSSQQDQHQMYNQQQQMHHHPYHQQQQHPAGGGSSLGPESNPMQMDAQQLQMFNMFQQIMQQNAMYNQQQQMYQNQQKQEQYELRQQQNQYYMQQQQKQQQKMQYSNLMQSHNQYGGTIQDPHSRDPRQERGHSQGGMHESQYQQLNQPLNEEKRRKIDQLRYNNFQSNIQQQQEQIRPKKRKQDKTKQRNEQIKEKNQQQFENSKSPETQNTDEDKKENYSQREEKIPNKKESKEIDRESSRNRIPDEKVSAISGQQPQATQYQKASDYSGQGMDNIHNMPLQMKNYKYSVQNSKSKLGLSEDLMRQDYKIRTRNYNQFQQDEQLSSILTDQSKNQKRVRKVLSREQMLQDQSIEKIRLQPKDIREFKIPDKKTDKIFEISPRSQRDGIESNQQHRQDEFNLDTASFIPQSDHKTLALKSRYVVPIPQSPLILQHRQQIKSFKLPQKLGNQQSEQINPRVNKQRSNSFVPPEESKGVSLVNYKQNQTMPGKKSDNSINDSLHHNQSGVQKRHSFSKKGGLQQFQQLANNQSIEQCFSPHEHNRYRQLQNDYCPNNQQRPPVTQMMQPFNSSDSNHSDKSSQLSDNSHALGNQKQRAVSTKSQAMKQKYSKKGHNVSEFIYKGNRSDITYEDDGIMSNRTYENRMRNILMEQMSPRTKFIYMTFPNKKSNDNDSYGENERSHASLAAHKKKQEALTLCIPFFTNTAAKEEDKPVKTEFELYCEKQTGNNILNGEMIHDEFSCAIELRILIQGTLYVSSEALYFHSKFNDSSLFFGGDTKIRIPYTDIKSTSKAKMAKIFNNSIIIQLFNDLQFFFTSFLSRDKCYSIILKNQRKMKIKGKNEDSDQDASSFEDITRDQPHADAKQHDDSGDMHIGQSGPQVYPSSKLSQPANYSNMQQYLEEEKRNYEKQGSDSIQSPQEQEQEHMQEDEVDEGGEIWKDQGQLNEMMDGSQELLQLEQERMNEIKNIIPHYNEGYNWHLYSAEIPNCPLKHIVQSLMYNYKNKFTCEGLANQSLHAYMNCKVFNYEISFHKGPEPKQGEENPALSYFMDRKAGVPDLKTMKQTWPLSHPAYVISYTHKHSNPHPMMPKETTCEDTHTDYYVSPRKFIRICVNRGSGFTYCDNFYLESMFTLTQLGNGPTMRTKIELDHRFHSIKKIMVFQSLVVQQSEEQSRNTWQNFFNEDLKSLLKSTLDEIEERARPKNKNQQNVPKIQVNKRQLERQISREIQDSIPKVDRSPRMKRRERERREHEEKEEPQQERYNLPAQQQENRQNRGPTENEVRLRSELDDLKFYFKLFAALVVVIQLVQLFTRNSAPPAVVVPPQQPPPQEQQEVQIPYALPPDEL